MYTTFGLSFVWVIRVDILDNVSLFYAYVADLCAEGKSYIIRLVLYDVAK